MRSFGSVSSSRARMSFCWLPPESVDTVTSTLSVRMSNVLTNRAASSLIFLMNRTPSAPGELGVVLAPEHRVLPQRHVEDEALLVPVLGDVAHPGVADVEHRAPRDRRPLELDRAGCRRAQPDQGLRQLALPVALDAGHTQDLPRVDLETHAVQLPLAGEVLDPQDRLADLHRRLLEPEQHGPAHHHLGQLRLGGLGGSCLADHSSPAEHRDPVRDLHDLVQLVADEHDRPPRFPELAEVAEQVLGLIGGEDGGRLVQDEDLHAPIQRLEDLDALFLADR